MEILIHFEEEVVITTVDNQGQLTFLHRRHQVNDCMSIPNRLIAGFFSQLITHIPVLRERTDVYTTAGRSGSTKYIGVTNGIPHRAVSAHT